MLPVAGTLAQPLTLPAGTILAAAVHDAHGALLYPAGALLAQAVTLPADARLGAGSVLSRRRRRWRRCAAPAGVALTDEGKPSPLVLAGKLNLPRGAPAGRRQLPDGASMVELRADKAGTQGRNWALAAMLPAGSQSWGLRLVGGADLGADPRAVGVDPRAGHVVLADTHYAARVVDNIKIMITEEGELMGMGPRGPRCQPFLGICDWLPEACGPWRSSARSGVVAGRAGQSAGPHCRDRRAQGRAGRLRSQPGVLRHPAGNHQDRERAGTELQRAAHGRGRSGRGRGGRCAAGVALRRLHGGHRRWTWVLPTGRRVAWCRARAACWAARAATTKNSSTAAARAWRGSGIRSTAAICR